MRKLSAIFVFFCLLFSLAGYQVVYHLRIAEAKQDMRRELLAAPSGAVQNFVFTSDEMESVAWEGTSEFRYKGEMYDVLRMERTGGKTAVWCLADRKETALLQQYQNTQKQSSGTSGLLLKLLSSQYLPCSVAVLAPIEPVRQQACVFFQRFFPEGGNNIITPPPRVC